MASSQEFLDFILEQLAELPDIRYRKMMGEYIIYYNDKIVFEICDDRLLAKVTKVGLVYFHSVKYAKPYPGAKDMIVVDDVDDRDYLVNYVKEVINELPNKRK